MSGQPPAAHPAPDITPAFIRQCLYNNERGDGTLFAAMHRDRFCHVKTTGQWLAWSGHHWQTDRADLVHDAVEQVAMSYLSQAMALKEEIKQAKDDGKQEQAKFLQAEHTLYTRRIDRLRGLKGAKNCMEYAHKIGAQQSIAIIGDEIDQQPWLLACPNTVIDLKTGEPTSGRPRDYLVTSIPVEWPGLHHPAPTWEAFISQIHRDDPEMVAFIRRIMGYAITGLTTEHFIACFVGEGRNGKGTMFDTIKAVLGDLAWSVAPELILEQKISRSSAGPSSDMVALQGKRLVVASETDEHRKISGSKVKLLTGGNAICARSPFDRFERNFWPTHTLMLETNHIPVGLTRDYALLKRLLLIDYPLKFVDGPKEQDERPRDPDLKAKLAEEYPGILAWLVRGCLEWQAVGIQPPARIRADVEELRVSEDTFLQFFNDRLQEDADGALLFKTMYLKFAEWYAEEIDQTSQRYLPTKKAVSAWLDKRGFVRQKPGGHATVYGIAFRQDDPYSLAGQP